MKHLISLFLVVFYSLSFYSQQSAYLVFFKDKNHHSLLNANTLLSKKALEKRKNAFIALDSYDIPVSKTYLNELKKYNKVMSKSKWLNAAFIYSPFSELELKQNYYFIKRAVKLKRKEKSKKNLASSGNSRSDSSLYNYTFNQLETTKTISCLHNNNNKGDGIVIAVLDAGFPKLDSMVGFNRLRNENRIIDTWDFEDDSSYVYHKSNHGTFVSSIITGELDSNFIGSAPNATFAFYITEMASVEVNLEEYNLVLGLERADSIGADIASISLGYRDFDSLQTSYGYAGMDGQTTIASFGVRTARDKGMIIVSSAGNSGRDGVGSISSPCDVDSILCIGAINYDSSRANFSSEGPTFDGRIKPDVTTIGDSCYFIGLNDTVRFGNGTSFSAPLISGLVACIKQAHPIRNNYQIINAIKQGSHLNLSPDNIFGWGIPNSCLVDSILTVLDSNLASVVNQPKFMGSIFPNPTNGDLNIKTKHLLKEIKIYDLLGNLVLNYSITNYNEKYKIPVFNLKKGNYILKILSINDVLFSERFIKN